MAVRGTIHLLESAALSYGNGVRVAVEGGIERHESYNSNNLLWMVGDSPDMHRAKKAIGCDGRGIRSVFCFNVDDGHGGLVVEGIEHRLSG